MIHQSSFRSSLVSYVVAFAVLLAMPLGLARAADTAKVTPSDQVQFQQKYLQAQMQELQERMFHLAEVTREAEPDDAARLLLAVRKANEQLIIEDMKSALNMLASSDFSHADEKQAQIIAKLEELKKLLTSSDLDLQLQLERLRALNKAIAKLDAATKEEKREQAANTKLGEEQKAKPADAKALEGAQKDQQQNQKVTDSIAQTVKDLGGQAVKAAQSLGAASQSMTMAVGALGSSKPSDASFTQIEAIKSMDEAKKQLNEERDKIMQELERMVRKQVVMNLQEMLERQKSVRGATEGILAHADSALDRESMLKIKQLGTAETAIVRIADQTIALIEETQFSVALPPALKQVQQKMAVIAAQLDDSRVNAPIVVAEKDVEKDLQDLLDTFKELSKAKVTSGNCNCKGDKNKLLAELKVIRLMQTRTNSKTETVNNERGEAAPAFELPANINPMLKEKILAVRDSQADVRTAMEKIHEQMTGPDDPQDQAQDDKAQEQPK